MISYSTILDRFIPLMDSAHTLHNMTSYYLVYTVHVYIIHIVYHSKLNSRHNAYIITYYNIFS